MCVAECVPGQRDGRVLHVERPAGERVHDRVRVRPGEPARARGRPERTPGVPRARPVLVPRAAHAQQPRLRAA